MIGNDDPLAVPEAVESSDDPRAVSATMAAADSVPTCCSGRCGLRVSR